METNEPGKQRHSKNAKSQPIGSVQGAGFECLGESVRVSNISFGIYGLQACVAHCCKQQQRVNPPYRKRSSEDFHEHGTGDHLTSRDDRNYHLCLKYRSSQD